MIDVNIKAFSRPRRKRCLCSSAMAPVISSMSCQTAVG